MTSPPYWHDAKQHLSQTDPVLGQIIDSYRGEWMLNFNNAFHTLARAITGQQISVKAADAVWARLETLLLSKTPDTSLHPEQFFLCSEEELRACGLSRSKIAYIGNIAHAIASGDMTPDQWPTMPDADIQTQLVAVKGIGVWTAQMCLIFHLHRPDILPLADLGLIKAIEKHYTNGETLAKKDLSQITEPWTPYRTVATWYLWRSLDPVPVQY